MHELPAYITAEIFGFFLTFCRVGTCIMLLPALGSVFIPQRVRLVLSLALSLAIMPTVPHFPQLDNNPAIVLYQIFSEIVIGLMIGSIAKIIAMALNVAGQIIGTQAGLGQAMLFNPNTGAQISVFDNFLEIMFLALLFTLNLHHVLIFGLVQSYTTFPPVPSIPFADFAQLITQKVSESFAIGVQMAAPLIIVGIIINLASGLLARLMPSLQVFYIILPAQIALSFFIFAATLSAMMIWYMDKFEDSITSYLAF
jgi:flagellar biosynthetic protein FliR